MALFFTYLNDGRFSQHDWRTGNYFNMLEEQENVLSFCNHKQNHTVLEEQESFFSWLNNAPGNFFMSQTNFKIYISLFIIFFLKYSSNNCIVSNIDIVKKNLDNLMHWRWPYWHCAIFEKKTVNFVLNHKEFKNIFFYSLYFLNCTALFFFLEHAARRPKLYRTLFLLGTCS